MVTRSLKFWASSLLYATLLRECHAQQSDANIGSELGGKLSSDASIYFPGSALFNNATARWSQFGKPNISVVVEVANKYDVVETVKYATAHNVSFIAINGGHGNIDTLENVHNGIEIWMHKLNSVQISAKGDTATFGGGVLSHQVIESLWASGKQTVTGVCDCTGFLGPALGGGHGYLQGRHGLIADNFVSLEVVTADGAIRTVTDKGPESDLFWAMKGAGHNFGIVTSFTQKIYDVPNNGVWSFVKHTYTQDKLELLFQYLNILGNNGRQRVDVMYWATINRNTDVDPVNPVIDIFVLQEGVETMDAEVSLSLLNFAPAVTVTHSGPYVNISTWTEFNIGSRACDKGDEGPQIARFPINLKSYNLEALRSAFNTFAQVTANNSALTHSTIMLEGYSNQGVQAVDEASTAYPHRDDTILVSSVIISMTAADRPAAMAFGDNLRDIFHTGTGEAEKHVYVNYASGDESLESIYGYEPWRKNKLSTLKAKYDPENRFGFYAPIPAAGF
ncbi:hypothetical protein BDV26DRAFT_282481 [Aspergillus bertholletiae]|uniref:FAD-binding PCMH-type domain-containing protein n=1 Tax=Aspergillus bertholletiae TaxID=1226010 RepID=A0A5N7B572_9EURO|nr:hypothetical protein BDV26DRAFT_282481 [Aspergillus bertholletiae]